jgi:hypothetical protein
LSSLTLAILTKPPALPGESHERESFSALILLTALSRLLLSALLSRLLTALAGLLTALAGLLTRLLLPAAALLAALPTATLVLLVGALFVRIHHFHSCISRRRDNNKSERR